MHCGEGLQWNTRNRECTQLYKSRGGGGRENITWLSKVTDKTSYKISPQNCQQVHSVMKSSIFSFTDHPPSARTWLDHSTKSDHRQSINRWAGSIPKNCLQNQEADWIWSMGYHSLKLDLVNKVAPHNNTGWLETRIGQTRKCSMG